MVAGRYDVMNYGPSTTGREPSALPVPGESARDSGPGFLQPGPYATPGEAGVPALTRADAVVVTSSWWGRVVGVEVPAWLPLLVVLVVQAVASVRLVAADTAFQDEATYLWAGHLEWAHLLHGWPVPPFASYFSGAPVIYPPLGALADSVAGLAGARLLSLVFMLGSTVLVWDVSRRLSGRRAAFFSAALFAVLGPTLHLGSFATYDALSVFLVAAAAWCATSARENSEAAGRMAAAGALLALANATAYSTALFDPVVVIVALLIALPSGRRVAARRCAALVMVLAALLIAGLLLGGSTYLSGVEQTTLARAPGSDPVLAVLGDAWTWTGVVLVLAVCGVITSWATRRGARHTWLMAILAAAAVLGPLEQANLHTLAALNKHIGLGAWFAAIAAGYAADTFIAAAPTGRSRTLTCAACVIALAFPATFGITQSWTSSTSWPSSASFIAIFRPLASHTPGHLLVEDPTIAEYYLPAGHTWQRWSSTRNIVLPTGASTGHPAKAAGVTGPGDPATFARYIAEGYFSLVALNYADTTTLDHTIRADLARNHHYRIAQVIPYGTHGTYIIYRYQAPQ